MVPAKEAAEFLYRQICVLWVQNMEARMPKIGELHRYPRPDVYRRRTDGKIYLKMSEKYQIEAVKDNKRDDYFGTGHAIEIDPDEEVDFIAKCRPAGERADMPQPDPKQKAAEEPAASDHAKAKSPLDDLSAY